MRIVATADLHGHFPEIPPCDLLIIAGDVCPVYDHTLNFQLQWLNGNFREWLNSVPAQKIIGISGNHDFVFERNQIAVESLSLPWIYLQDSSDNNIWGIPWVPNLSRWAFYALDHKIDEKLCLIPTTDIDIVISHGPPHGYCDLTVPKFGACNAGFPGINDMLNRIKPKVLVCGHIHEGYGISEHPSGATIYNVSHMTENYEPINPPMVIDFEGT